MFSWQPSGSFPFSCDHQAGSCDAQLTNYRSQMDNLVSGLQSDQAASAALYKEAEDALESAKQQWLDERVECLEKHESRQVSMCLFGVDLQRKCGLVAQHRDLMAEVDAVDGSNHAHTDR